MLALVVCIIIGSCIKLKLFRLLFSSAYIFISLLYYFLACVSSDETNEFLNIGADLWPILFYSVVRGWILQVLLEWNNAHFL